MRGWFVLLLRYRGRSSCLGFSSVMTKMRAVSLSELVRMTLIGGFPADKGP